MNSNGQPDVRLDSPQRCIAELSSVNEELGKFGYRWAKDAGELKSKLVMRDRLHKAALRGMGGRKLTVADKDAAADAAVETASPGLSEAIERLEGSVEESKVKFRTLDRRSGNAQSILSALKDEAKQSEYMR